MTFSYASCVFSIGRNLFCFRYSCNTSFLWLFVILSVGSSIRCSDFMGDVQVVCSCLQIALWGPLFFFWSSFVTKCRSCVKFWAVKCCPVNSNWQNTMLYFGKSCWHRIVSSLSNCSYSLGWYACGPVLENFAVLLCRLRLNFVIGSKSLETNLQYHSPGSRAIPCELKTLKSTCG